MQLAQGTSGPGWVRLHVLSLHTCDVLLAFPDTEAKTARAEVFTHQGPVNSSDSGDRGPVSAAQYLQALETRVHKAVGVCMAISELRSCVKKSRSSSWAPVTNKPTVFVDVKQHSTTARLKVSQFGLAERR